MATLRACLKKPICNYKPIVSSRLIATTAVINKAITKQAYKPGKYPTTPEERIAAAKKYGLHIDDYKPIADDGFGVGDYPDLEPKSISARDHYYDWDYPSIRRNYNEPRYAREDYIKPYKFDESRRYVVPLKKQMWIFLTFSTVVTLLHLYLPRNPTSAPMMAKQYPYGSLHLEHGGDPHVVPDVKHYTFEPAE